MARRLVYGCALLALMFWAGLVNAGIPATSAECQDNVSQEKALTACTAFIAEGNHTPKEMAHAYFRRAVAHDNFSEDQEAMADITKAMELDPTNGQYVFGHGNMIWTMDTERKQSAKVIADYTKAIALQPDSALYYASRCHIYFTQRNLSAAKADCNKALELDPDSREAAAAMEEMGQGN